VAESHEVRGLKGRERGWVIGEGAVSPLPTR